MKFPSLTRNSTDFFLVKRYMCTLDSHSRHLAPTSYINPLALAAGATRSFGGNFAMPCNANVKLPVLELARGLKYKIPREELVLQEK